MKIVEILRIAMLGSIVLFVLVGEIAARTLAVAPASDLYFAITLVAIVVVVMISAVRRWFVLKAEATLAVQPADAAALARCSAGYIVTYAMCEAVALFGLVLRLNGFTLSQVAPFYAIGLVLMLFFAPHRPLNEMGR
ncbi:membrane hypothetical protein [Candidatus Sulfotelmatobacter sp. SbA7]|nr:membrane hypothetical protein [Candidatus Sulfotelmatobacter sp. SbA7]